MESYYTIEIILGYINKMIKIEDKMHIIINISSLKTLL